MALWNPWHGCKKYSEGCLNCYVYRIDSAHGRDPSEVFRTKDFDLPGRKKRNGTYKLLPGETVYTCFSSDFFLEAADEWRAEAWKLMRRRSDLRFMFITKRICRAVTERLFPDDWGGGYDNVMICCTAESQRRAEERLPVYAEAPIKHKHIICEPLLERVDLSQYLGMANLEGVTVGGESGKNARICDYEWVLDIRRACLESGIPFTFKQTGTHFKKDGRIYTVERRLQHSQAKKANINLFKEG